MRIIKRFSALDRVQRRRFAIFGGVVTGLAIGYLALVIVMANARLPFERSYESGSGAKRLFVYVDIVGVSATRDDAHLRLSFADGAGPRGALLWNAPDRDITVEFSDGDQDKVIHLYAGREAPAVDIDADLSGSEASYPFEHYHTSVYLSAYEGRTIDPRRAIPLRLTIWELLRNWVVSTREQSERGHAIELALTLQRSSPIRFFAAVTYIAMAIVGLSAFTIGSLTYLGIRNVEATLVGAIGAAVFALPALRNALPDAPPIGIWPDILVFLWAEVAAVTALGLFVWRWARKA
jgi:hypothetical protein